MIRYHVDGTLRDFNAGGDLATIAAEATSLFGLVYANLREMNPESAEEFKDAVIRIVGNPNNSMWTRRLSVPVEGCLIVVPEGGNHE